MLTIHVWPRRLKEFLLTHPLYKSPCNVALEFTHFLASTDQALAKAADF